MRTLIITAMAALTLGTAAASTAAPPVMAPPVMAHLAKGCLEQSRLLSRAAYHPDTSMPAATCGHVLSTETVIKPRPSDHT